MIVVNARFLTQNLTGVQRFAIEISKQLKSLYGDNIQFVTPHGIIHEDIAKLLKAQTIGSRKGHIWEQLDLPAYLKKQGNPLLLNLSNTSPIFYKNKISTLHDIAFIRFPQTFSWKFRYLYKILIPLILKSSRHILTVSQFSRDEISSYYKIPDHMISVIYNAVDPQFSPSSQPSHDPMYALAVSSLHYQKNFHRLVEAFDIIKHQELYLYVVGSINQAFADTKLLDILHTNPRIKMLGRVDDETLINLYRHATCFLFPSLYEGFGIPPLEAQACGTPVITSNCASLPEVCKNSALYFDPYDIDDMALKIDLMMDNHDLHDYYRKQGFLNLQRFSWKESARSLQQIIDPCL